HRIGIFRELQLVLGLAALVPRHHRGHLAALVEDVQVVGAVHGEIALGAAEDRRAGGAEEQEGNQCAHGEIVPRYRLACPCFATASAARAAASASPRYLRDKGRSSASSVYTKGIPVGTLSSTISSSL